MGKKLQLLQSDKKTTMNAATIKITVILGLGTYEPDSTDGEVRLLFPQIQQEPTADFFFHVGRQ